MNRLLKNNRFQSEKFAESVFQSQVLADAQANKKKTQVLIDTNCFENVRNRLRAFKNEWFRNNPVLQQDV